MSEDRDKIIEKIEKLLRKAERAGTPEEAEAFYAGAQAMMSKWAIEETMLNLDRDEAAYQITSEEHIEVPKSGFWKSNCVLIHLLAKANDVKAIRIEAPTYSKWELKRMKENGRDPVKPKMTLVGTKRDCEHVKMMYASMRIQVTRAGNAAIPVEYKGKAREGFIWRRSFLDAFSERIYQRLIEAKRAAEAEVKSEGADSNRMALAVVKKDELVVKAYELAFPDARKIKTAPKLADQHGLNEGRKAADRADIGTGKGVNAPSTRSLGSLLP